MFGRMNIIDEGLLNEIRKAEERMSGSGIMPRGIRDATRGSYPPINIGVSPEGVDVYLFAAGLNTEAVEITIHEQLLTIVGERSLMREAGAAYYRQERFNDEFRRTVTLPTDIDPDRVEAVYRDGVLHVSVKRRETSVPKRVNIA